MSEKRKTTTNQSCRTIAGEYYIGTEEKIKHNEKLCLVIQEKDYLSVDVTFETLAMQWLSEKEYSLKTSSFEKYTSILNKYLIMHLGNIPISQINTSIINNFICKLMSQTNPPLSTKTILDIISVLKNIIKYCNTYGIPIDLTGGKIITPSYHANPIRILSSNEQHRLIQYIKENPSLKNSGIILSLFTGIRIGELCALKWDHISLSEQTIKIEYTMQRLPDKNSSKKTKIVIDAPKSSSSHRIIPFPDALINFLVYPHDSSAYFLTGKPDKYTEPRVMQYHFKNVIKMCNISDSNFHSLRHTFATRCIEEEIDLKSLSEILGHSNTNITMNRYVHPSMECKKRNINKLSYILQ